jgi:hypothetical protein
VGKFDVLHHEVPRDGIADDLLGIVMDRQVGPTSHLKCSEMLTDSHGAHSDLLVKARRRRDIRRRARKCAEGRR